MASVTVVFTENLNYVTKPGQVTNSDLITNRHLVTNQDEVQNRIGYRFETCSEF
jgi:hypothetical protein